MRRRGDEHDQGRELGRSEDLKRLRFDVQYGDLAFLVDFPDGVQLRAVHGVVVGAYLTPVRRVCHPLGRRNDSAERRDTNGLKGKGGQGMKNKRRASTFHRWARGVRVREELNTNNNVAVNDLNVLRAG